MFWIYAIFQIKISEIFVAYIEKGKYVDYVYTKEVFQELLHLSSHLILTALLEDRYHYHSFTTQVTEIHPDYVTCSKSKS